MVTTLFFCDSSVNMLMVIFLIQISLLFFFQIVWSAKFEQPYKERKRIGQH